MSDAKEILEAHEPLSRDDLAQESVCEALWSEAGRIDSVSQTLHGVVQVYRAFDHSPAHQYEIGTALAYWDVVEVHDSRQSQGFKNQIHRIQYEQN